MDLRIQLPTYEFTESIKVFAKLDKYKRLVNYHSQLGILKGISQDFSILKTLNVKNALD